MIKKFTLSSLFLAFAVNVNAGVPDWFSSSDVPDWFGKKEEFVVKNRYQYIEFASGKTLEEARENARRAIAASIRIRVTDELDLTETKTNSTQNKEVTRQLKTKVDVMLSSPIDIVRVEESDDRVWIAAMYDATPALFRLKAMAVNSQEVSYASKPQFISEFEQSLGLGVNRILPPFRIDAENGFWQLLFSDNRVQVDDDILQYLFHRHNSSSVSVSLTSNRVKPGEEYYISLETKKPGYLSVIQLYQNGQSAVLIENQHIPQATEFTFPDKEIYDGLYNILDEQGNQSRDLTIALLCDSKQDLTAFTPVSSADTTSYQYSSPDELFKYKGCELATDVMVTTRP